MRATKHNKSTQTIPVIILPVQTPVPTKDIDTQLEKSATKQLQAYKPISNDYYFEDKTHSRVPLCENTGTIMSKQRQNENNHYDESYADYSSNSSKITLFKPIYVAKTTYHDDQSGKSWDIGDEFEYLEELSVDKSELRLKHLRTMTTTVVQSSQVELDDETPLRLGVRDRGTIECCLLKCNIRYCYLIRQSDQDDRIFVLSVNQPCKLKDTLLTHYLIRINKQNNCFYMEHDKKLRNRFFPTFRSLVHDQHVLEMISLSTPIDRNLLIYESELWQIDYSHLRIGVKIGAGEFGEIKHGQWKRKGVAQPIDVAIKTLKLRDEQSNAFAQEIRIMKLLRNRYLVSLFGITVDSITNQRLLITEFMNNGDLKTWLQKQHRMPSDYVLIRYALQMSLGMAHLERRKYTHRDLACRNVLLRDQQVKIADFGMADIVEEDPYEISKASGKLPILWTAPEIFTGTKYTSKSDVWSFGICLIEMWSKGDRPYSDIRAKEVVEKVGQGYVHEKPLNCPHEYYNKIIKSCLKKDQGERPSFEALTNIFKSLRSNKDDVIIENRKVKKHDSFKTYYSGENINETTATSSSTHHAEKVQLHLSGVVVDDFRQNHPSTLSKKDENETASSYEYYPTFDSAQTSSDYYELPNISSEESPYSEMTENQSTLEYTNNFF